MMDYSHFIIFYMFMWVVWGYFFDTTGDFTKWYEVLVFRIVDIVLGLISGSVIYLVILFVFVMVDLIGKTF